MIKGTLLKLKDQQQGSCEEVLNCVPGLPEQYDNLLSVDRSRSFLIGFVVLVGEIRAIVGVRSLPSEAQQPQLQRTEQHKAPLPFLRYLDWSAFLVVLPSLGIGGHLPKN